MIVSTEPNAYFPNTNLFTVFPNPGSDFMAVRNPVPDKQFTITLFNLVGNEILVKVCSSHYSEINTTSMRNGLYFYQIKNEIGILQSGKWLKE
jgi:hypothetical protein